jgi:hypothetical protein
LLTAVVRSQGALNVQGAREEPLGEAKRSRLAEKLSGKALAVPTALVALTS